MQAIYRRWDIFLVLSKYGLIKQDFKKMATEITYSRDIVSWYYGFDDFYETFTV
jgi:hypothetical protein